MATEALMIMVRVSQLSGSVASKMAARQETKLKPRNKHTKIRFNCIRLASCMAARQLGRSSVRPSVFELQIELDGLDSDPSDLRDLLPRPRHHLSDRCEARFRSLGSFERFGLSRGRGALDDPRTI